MDLIPGAKEGWRGKEYDATKKSHRGGAGESCVFLRIRESNLSIVRKLGISMRNYWGVVFLLFFEKTRMEKKNMVLLELLLLEDFLDAGLLQSVFF